MTRLPNFIYIGPDKAASSWLHNVLMHHPQIFMTPAKDLYFFDRYFDKGVDWYASHFAHARDEKIVGEVCQDYLFHPDAAARMRETLPDPRVMVTLRDPVERALSSYLYMIRIGERPGSFSDALRSRSILIDHSRYGSGLARFADVLGDERVYVGVFDHLQRDPGGYVASLLEWLGLEPLPLTEELLAIRLPASRARSTLVARVVRDAAAWVRVHDGAAIVGRVKRASLVQRALYVPLVEKPQVDPADAEFIWSTLDEEMAAVEERFGVDLRRQWGWRSK